MPTLLGDFDTNRVEERPQVLLVDSLRLLLPCEGVHQDSDVSDRRLGFWVVNKE